MKKGERKSSRPVGHSHIDDDVHFSMSAPSRQGNNLEDEIAKKTAAYQPKGRAHYLARSNNNNNRDEESGAGGTYRSRKFGSRGEDEDFMKMVAESKKKSRNDNTTKSQKQQFHEDLMQAGGYAKKKQEFQEEAGGLAQTPGAIRVAGVDSARRDDDFFRESFEVVDDDSPTYSPEREQTQSPSNTGDKPADETLVHAFLVDEAPPVEEADKDIPRVEAQAVQHKPWYKRPPILIGLAFMIAGIIGIVLGLTLRGDGGSSDVETMSPTVSPAPTAIATVTLVVQLDEMPIETGWLLECDGTEIQSVPEGSYAFLPIGLLIPSFRLELVFDLVSGSECVYTITDAGGNGLVGGFFEVYYGDDVGIDQNLIARGVPLSASTNVLFTIELPDGALEPTAAPVTQAPAVPTTEPPTFLGCTVCLDGSSVPNTDLILESGLTCGEMDDMARNVLNSTQCELEFQSLASDCGCTNFCDTLCPDGSLIDASEEDTLVRVDNGIPVTCGNLQDQVMVRDSSPSDCNTASFIGEEICNCPSEGNFCRICEPGGPNRLPANLSREIIPGVSCEDISGIAFTLLTSDPLFGVICPACLSIGAYCGCPVVENPRTFCRLCGGANLLPEPDRLVFSPQLDINTTCFHVEFFSNLGIAPNGTTSVIPDCSVVQEQNAAECCAA